MAQINKVRLPDGRTVRPTEWSSTPLYSTVEIDDASSLATLHAFSYGIGGTVPGSVGNRKSTITDTNMAGTGGVLPENQELLLYSLMVEFFTIVGTASDYRSGNDTFVPDPPHVSALNMARIQRDCLLEMRIADTKSYAEHPVGFFPAGMGIEMTLGAAENADGNLVHIGSNGGVNVGDARVFATPHRVGPGEAFEVALRFPSGSISGLNLGSDASARIRARIYADGYRRRPVA